MSTSNTLKRSTAQGFHMAKKDLIGINISTGNYQTFINKILNLAEGKCSSYVCVANVHMLVEGYFASDFANIVNNADIATPDGKPLTWAIRLLHGQVQDRVAGMDLLPALLKEAEHKKMSVFFYGGTNEMLKKTKAYLEETYPYLVSDFYSPPFRKLTQQEDDEVVDIINNSSANLVFVVLGCPKQEKWMAAMKNRINAVMIGVGGALPVMAGLQKRAPKWMQQTGLEWIYRLLQEPKRLFKRYAVTNSVFIYLLAKAYFKARVFKKNSVTIAH